MLVFVVCSNRLLFLALDETRSHRELGMIGKESVVVYFNALSRLRTEETVQILVRDKKSRTRYPCFSIERETAISSDVLSRKYSSALENMCFKLKYFFILSYI
jgi:hypothetical protein